MLKTQTIPTNINESLDDLYMKKKNIKNPDRKNYRKEKSEIIDKFIDDTDLQEVIKEVQSIIKNSTTSPKKTHQMAPPAGSNPNPPNTSWDREMNNLKFKKISPPLPHGSSKIISPRFSPRSLINNMNQIGFEETTSSGNYCSTPNNNLRSSSSNLFRAFSQSPSPKDCLVEVGKERILDESSEEERSIITPPLRTSNPIIYNSPFRKMIEKNQNVSDLNLEGGDIGLLSVSPPPSSKGLDDFFKNPDDDNVRVFSESVDGVNSISRTRLHSVEEIDELVFQFDSS